MRFHIQWESKLLYYVNKQENASIEFSKQPVSLTLVYDRYFHQKDILKHRRREQNL